MRNKYKKKSSIEQAKKEYKINNQTTIDSQNNNYSKILSPEINTKNLLFNGSVDTKDVSKNQYDISICKPNKKSKRNLFSLINRARKNNNIATVSHEFKNKRIFNNNNLKNCLNKYMNDCKEIKKENKENKINKENLKKEINISAKNIMKFSGNKINENIIKNNMSSDFDFIKKRLYHPLNNNYTKEQKEDINNEKKETTKNDELNKNRYIFVLKKSEENNRYKNYVKNTNNETIINGNIIYDNYIKNDMQKEEMKTINEKNISITARNNSLKYLIHQAHTIRELAESFNKVYIPNQPKINYKQRTFDPEVDNFSYDKQFLYKYDIRVNKREKKIENIGEIHKRNNSMHLNDSKIETILEKNENNNNNNKINRHIIDLKRKDFYQNKKKQKNNNFDELLQKNINNENNNNTINIEEANLYRNNSLELINKKSNNYNGGSLSEKKNNEIKKNWSFLNTISEHYINKNNNPKNNNINTNKYSFISVDSIKNNKYQNINMEFEAFYTLIDKLQKILEKMKHYKKCQDEIFDWINFFYNSNMFNKIVNIFISKNNQYSMSKFIKMEIVCILLCYDAFIHQNFNQINAYITSLFNLLYNNFLILYIYIIDNNNNIANNIFLKNKLKTLIINEENYNQYISQIKNEVDVLFFINNNFKEINNYYQYIFNTFYITAYNSILKDKIFLNKIQYNQNNNIIHFTSIQNNLTNNQKIGLISLFFYDYYKMPENYNFDDLYVFFEKFLSESNYINNNINNIFINKDNQLKYRDFSSIIYNTHNQFFLPPIKKCYQYTLVLDLDETLIYCRKDNSNYNNSSIKNRLIMRPGLLEFLHKMKQIYELVLFSLGTCSYVNNIVNIIEKKEKYFEYILYRQHATYNDNIYIKNLSLLGRDLKNIIIVDDIPEVFKLHKNNGICIKPFCGDVIGERNTLKFLGNILQKIRFDAEETGDIRTSLKHHRNLIFTHITTNLESN